VRGPPGLLRGERHTNGLHPGGTTTGDMLKKGKKTKRFPSRIFTEPQGVWSTKSPPKWFPRPPERLL